MYRSFHVTAPDASVFERQLAATIERINREKDWFISSVSHAASHSTTNSGGRSLFSAVLIVQQLGGR